MVIASTEEKLRNSLGSEKIHQWQTRNEKALGILGRALGAKYNYHLEISISAYKKWKVVETLLDLG